MPQLAKPRKEFFTTYVFFLKRFIKNYAVAHEYPRFPPHQVSNSVGLCAQYC